MTARTNHTIPMYNSYSMTQLLHVVPPQKTETVVKAYGKNIFNIFITTYYNINKGARCIVLEE